MHKILYTIAGALLAFTVPAHAATQSSSAQNLSLTVSTINGNANRSINGSSNSYTMTGLRVMLGQYLPQYHTRVYGAINTFDLYSYNGSHNVKDDMGINLLAGADYIWQPFKHFQPYVGAHAGISAYKQANYPNAYGLTVGPEFGFLVPMGRTFSLEVAYSLNYTNLSAQAQGTSTKIDQTSELQFGANFKF